MFESIETQQPIKNVWHLVSNDKALKIINEGLLQCSIGSTLAFYNDKNMKAIIKAEKQNGNWEYYERS